MPRPKSAIPKLCVDKSRNRAYCKVDGKFITLGPAGSQKAQAAYGRLLESLAQGRDVAAAKQDARSSARPTLSLSDLFLRFVSAEIPRYSRDEQACLKLAIRVARELFGGTPIDDFGPLKLRIIRQAMIEKGWSRGYINKQVDRLRRIIRWGVSWELVPQVVAQALSSLTALGPGETSAPESRPRRAVSDSNLTVVRERLSAMHQDVFDLLLLCGSRPGELLGLRTSDLDRSGELWRADLVRHKTAHLGKTRTLFFNAKAQSILRKYLSADPDELLFNVSRKNFGEAVKRACEVAFGMPAELRRKGLTPEQRAQAKAWRREHVWTPHFLRHTAATRLADDVGTEAAQRLLGHATRAMTEHYSKAAEKQAQEAAKRLG